MFLENHLSRAKLVLEFMKTIDQGYFILYLYPLASSSKRREHPNIGKN
jgi:hypothetical protein